MTVYPVIDLGLVALVLGVAASTIMTRDTFGAIVGYVAYGLLVSIVWIRLFAPDVALTEAAIGGGVTGVMLVAVGARLRYAGGESEERDTSALLRLAAAALSLLVAAALAAAVLLLPEPPPTLAPEATLGLPDAGLGNAVTAVLMVYRGFDTMLEKVVMVLAVVGVWSVASDRSWGGAPALLGMAKPEAPLRFLAQTLAPIGVLIGIHVFWVSADYPGGAFQGGAILAAMWMIVMMAGIIRPPRIDSTRLRVALIGGPAVFLVTGLLGAWVAVGFFAYPAGFVKPVILFIEVFMLLSIAVTLPMLVVGPPHGDAEP